MKTVDVIVCRERTDRDGSVVVNLEYVVTDELEQKSAGAASYAVSDRGAIKPQANVVIAGKLGYQGFTVRWPRETLKANGRT